MNKLINYVLVFFVVLTSSSCMVYQKTSMSLEEAHDRGNVQVVTNAGKELEFKNIILDDNIYYGINRRSDISNIALDAAHIQAIYPKNKSKSIVLTSVLVAPFLALLIYSLINADSIF